MDDKLEEAYRLGFEEGVRHTACARGVWLSHLVGSKEWGRETERCSLCGFIDVDKHTFNYCPNCGAKMEGE